MILRKILKQGEKYVEDNAAAILTAIGVIGTVGTAVLTHRAALQTVDKVRDEQMRLFQETPNNAQEVDEMNMSKMDVIKLAWLYYLPPVGAGLATVGCIIFANRISTKRAAAMAAAYSLSAKELNDYRAKVIEKFGDKKEEEVSAAVAQDQIDANPPRDNQVYILGNADVLFHEALTGRYFRSNMQDIRKAENDIRELIINDYFASLTTFFERLGLDGTDMSDELGFNLDHMIELRFTSLIAENDEPCISMKYTVAPVRNYDKIR